MEACPQKETIMKISSSKSILKGDISVPGSKSHTIRAVAIASMADGVSKIIAPLISEDTISALGAASEFGAGITKEAGIWTVTGTNGKITAPAKTVDMGNSGTSLRIFSALASLSNSKISFDGDNSLRTRLMQPLLSALEPIGVSSVSTNGKCPLSIQGPLKGGKTRVEGKSSQFVTAVLLSCPLAPEDSEIEVFNLNEKPYVEITIDWMKKQKLDFECNSSMTLFKIKGRQSYKPFELAIPADFSTACFPLVASAVTGSSLKINNLDFSDRQGDKEVFSFMEKMGMKVE
ncbi:MAG: 3-phosphoshikimate 1-carboxyvinyltransferase, partial [Candidatus Delongbacteria bacterium]|nr:3-phosphoshikimate 1-carboxyvinyltransferase [Candidatus Delongbacteria bacterium]